MVSVSSLSAARHQHGMEPGQQTAHALAQCVAAVQVAVAGRLTSSLPNSQCRNTLQHLLGTVFGTHARKRKGAIASSPSDLVDLGPLSTASFLMPSHVHVQACSSRGYKGARGTRAEAGL